MKLTMDPTIPSILYSNKETSNSKDDSTQFYGVPLTIKRIKDYIQYTTNYNNQTLTNVVNKLDDIIKTMKGEKSKYEDFQKSLITLSESKKIMEKNMKFYHQKMLAAELAVLEFNKIKINMKYTNNTEAMKENADIIEAKAKQLTDETIKPFNIYKNSVSKANEIRIECYNKEKKLLYIYQEIEEQLGKFNMNNLKMFFQNQRIQKDFIDDNYEEMSKNIKIDNIEKDIKQLILDYAGHESPDEEIKFIYFPANIDFEKAENNKTYELFKESINYIKKIIPEEFPNYNSELEAKKNNMREITYRLFTIYSNEDKNKLFEYFEDDRVYAFFLILLLKLRTSTRFKQNNELIDLLGNILNKILIYAEKTKIMILLKIV